MVRITRVGPAVTLLDSQLPASLVLGSSLLASLATLVNDTHTDKEAYIDI